MINEDHEEAMKTRVAEAQPWTDQDQLIALSAQDLEAAKRQLPASSPARALIESAQAKLAQVWQIRARDRE